jgi:hypothetical protein
MTDLADGESQNHWPQPGLWSLWDMWNLALFEFKGAMEIVAQIFALAGRVKQDHHDGRDYQIAPERREAIKMHLFRLQEMFERARFESSGDHVRWIMGRIDNQEVMTGDKLIADMSKLNECLTDDARRIFAYVYKRDRAMLVSDIKTDWAVAIESFPSAAPEIRAAVDLYCMEHPTASVFHLMRAVEVALRVLAKQLRVKLPKGKPIEVAQWQEILDGIDDAKGSVAQSRASPAKSRAFEFYSSAGRHMEGFKDKYRNAVSHSIKRYEDHEALSCMIHVRDFMNGLGAKIGEGKPVRAIKF